MSKPSDGWANTDWNAFVQKRSKFANVKRDQILIVASELRSGLPCILSPRFTDGSFHAIFEIIFEDGVIWICRVRHSDPEESLTFLTLSIESTLAGMQYIRQHTTLPVPQIYSFETNPSNQIGGCYMCMEAMGGNSRSSSTRAARDPSELASMYDQIAEGAVQMAKLEFPKIGRIYLSAEGKFNVGPFVDPNGTTYGPFSSSMAYYNYLAERSTSGSAITDKYAGHLYRLAANKLVLGNNGPFRVCHGDYGTHNMLFDDTGKLTGIVDWDFVHVAPPLSCCIWPALVQIRWPLLANYWPRVLEDILKRQQLYLDGVKAAELTWDIDPSEFEGQQMSTVVGSDQAIVAQIIEVLGSDSSYKDYNGKRVFEFLFGDADFELARERYLQDENSSGST